MDAHPTTRSSPIGSDVDPAGPAADGDARGRRPTASIPWFVSWPVLALLLCLPGVLWALASPLFSAPDEPSHTVKAVALWHGQLGGEDAMRPNGYLTTTYQIPAVWAQASPFRECFAFNPDVTADCSPPFAGSASISGADSTAGRYPPLFYALVGWPARFSDGPAAAYLMRITGAIACGLLMAMGVRALARVIDTRLALVGVLVAATPMTTYLTGTVNPNGLEIAAAVAVWSTTLAILRWGDHHDGPVPRTLVASFTIAAATVAVIRPLSPAFLGAIGVLALIASPRTAIGRVLRDRSVLVALGVVAVVASLAMASVLTSDVFTAVPGRMGVGTANPALVIIGETDDYVTEMIGVFGWLDTQPPTFTVLAWLAATFGIVAIALALGTRRGAVALLATLAATFAIPIAAQYPGASSQGLAWQGRYTLPIAVGLPILAAVLIGERPRAFTARLTVGLAALTGAASVAAFYWALRRYTTGATGGLRIWAAPWQPPGGSLLLVVATAAVAVAAVAILVLAARVAEPATRSVDHDDG